MKSLVDMQLALRDRQLAETRRVADSAILELMGLWALVADRFPRAAADIKEQVGGYNRDLDAVGRMALEDGEPRRPKTYADNVRDVAEQVNALGGSESTPADKLCGELIDTALDALETMAVIAGGCSNCGETNPQRCNCDVADRNGNFVPSPRVEGV